MAYNNRQPRSASKCMLFVTTVVDFIHLVDNAGVMSTKPLVEVPVGTSDTVMYIETVASDIKRFHYTLKIIYTIVWLCIRA